MFRFLIQKKVEAKNEVTRNLFSSAIEKFNGYEMILEDLACKERGDKAPINIALEPIFEDNIPVPCFFTDQIYLAYKTYVGRFEKVKSTFQIVLLNSIITVKISVPRTMKPWKNIALFVLQGKE